MTAARAVGAAYSHLAIVVADLRRAAGFYERALGFVRADEPFRGSGPELARLMGVDEARIEGLFLSGTGVTIELLCDRQAEDQNPALAPLAAGYRHLSFVVDDVDAAMEAVRVAGGSPFDDSLVRVDMGAGAPVAMAFVADPDGNRIELIQHLDRESAVAHSRFLGCRSLGWPPTPRRTNVGEASND